MTKLKIWIDFAAIGLLIIVLGMLVYTIFMVKSDGGECIKSPLVYGIKQLEEENPRAIGATATVHFDNPQYRSLIVSSKGIRYAEGINKEQEIEINYSDLADFNYSKYVKS